jgi:hypothetical protein
MVGIICDVIPKPCLHFLPHKLKPKDWPKELRDQIQMVRALLTSQPQSVATLAARFKRKPAKAVQTVLEALQGLGLAQHNAEGWRS